MHWKKKAHLQNVVSLMPEKIGDEFYYFIQRNFGTLKQADKSLHHLYAAVEIADYISKNNSSIEGKTFFELGTGRYLNLPIALWLMGASKIIGADISRYLKAESVLMNLQYISENPEKVKNILGKYCVTPLFKERFSKLINVQQSLESVLSLINFEYHAPADASALNMKNESIDYYISYNVLEFILPEKLGPILIEAKRLLTKDGLFIHSLDFSDLFSEFDKSITSINFLQFSEKEWMKYAGNKYMYHNRMRVDDYEKLFAKLQIQILMNDKLIDEEVLKSLKNGFCINDRFMAKSQEIVATKSAWVIAKKN